jgi:hypothetical protein
MTPKKTCRAAPKVARDVLADRCWENDVISTTTDSDNAFPPVRNTPAEKSPVLERYV